jgi:hypothetical protein
LLLSAIAGDNFDLALTLLRMGASPNDQVDANIGIDGKPVRATIWELVVLMIATSAIDYSSGHNGVRDANALCIVFGAHVTERYIYTGCTVSEQWRNQLADTYELYDNREINRGVSTSQCRFSFPVT